MGAALDRHFDDRPGGSRGNSMTRPLQRFFRSLLGSRRAEHELDEELQYHLERETQQRILAGLSQREARDAALRAMGPITQSREQCREARGMNLMDNLAR